VLVEDGADCDADLGLAAKRPALALDSQADAAQVPRGRGQEILALAGALVSQKRIAAEDQALVRERLRRHDLGAVALV
jgi:hypothetical protein